MKKTFISLMMVATFMAANGQEKKQEIKVADETFIVINSATTTGTLKIKSSNEKISSALLKKFTENIIRYNVAMKKDRFGSYAEYSLYFKKEAEKNIIDFLKSL